MGTVKGTVNDILGIHFQIGNETQYVQLAAGLAEHQSNPFSFKNSDIKSAISILFKSENGKWVFP